MKSYLVVGILAFTIACATAITIPTTIHGRDDLSQAHFGKPFPFVIQDLSIRLEKLTPPWDMTIQSPWNNPTSFNVVSLLLDVAFFYTIVVIISYCIGRVVAFFRSRSAESATPIAPNIKSAIWPRIMMRVDAGLPTLSYPLFVIPVFIAIFMFGLFFGFGFGIAPILVSSTCLFWIGNKLLQLIDNDFLNTPFVFEHLRHSILLYISGAILLWLYNFTSLEFGGPYNLGMIVTIGVLVNALVLWVDKRCLEIY